MFIPKQKNCLRPFAGGPNRWRWWLGLLLVAGGSLIPGGIRAQSYVPGETYFDRKNYIEYDPGDLPVIISAPHGGSLVPSEIPTRQDDGSDPNFTTVTDSYTEETALALRDVLAAYFGHLPHVVICHLKRTKIDCNRSLDQGVYQTNAYATLAWQDFQAWINTASNAAVAQNGRGFYIDQHGQGHAVPRLELGYLLSASQLTNTDARLNLPAYAAQSSIRSLAAAVSNQWALPFAQILRGSNSFGGLMAAQGFPSVPSPNMPSPGNGTNPVVYPGDENSYFDGGYNTAVHTSQTGRGPVDGLQIEANYAGVRDSAAARTNYARAVAATLDYFFTNYYGLDLRLAAPCSWTGGDGKLATATNWLTGVKPVAGNYLLFSGAGGAVNHNLAALTTGTGRIYSLLYASNAAGSYTNYGNPVSLVAGLTNFSARDQYLSNHFTLLAAQTFSAVGGAVNLAGNVTNGGFRLSVDSAANFNLSGAIRGTGGLNKFGTGSLTLGAASTYTGPTTNFAGTLLANNGSGNANGNGPLWVNPGATLGGTGIVSGPVTIAGTLSPGALVGTLRITNSLIFADGGGYRWTLAANSTNSPGVNYDQIVLSGGSLQVPATASLTLVFAGQATAPATSNAFWQVPHAWRIITLGATATNPGRTGFQVIANNNFSAGKFICNADDGGQIVLNYQPTPAPLVTPKTGTGTARVSLFWSGVAGVTYQIQAATNLATGGWQLLGNVAATGGQQEWSDTNVDAAQRFYRVVIP